MNTVCRCAFYIPARLAGRLRWAFNLIVALDSPGPPIFRQERLGLNGKPFMIYKFRTMRLDAKANGPRWAAVCDTRCTRFGQLLRRTRLDELPQLWNILRGDMSLVGPRPERAYFYREFETYMAMNIAKMLFPLLTLPYLTRVLSTDCYGSVVYVKSVTTYLQLLVDFGFVLSAAKSIVQAREDRARQERIMGGCAAGDLPDGRPHQDRRGYPADAGPQRSGQHPLRRWEKDGEIRLLPGLWRQGAQALSREKAGGKGEVNKTVLKLPGAVRESYDYVLIDLPPLGSVIDAAVVAAKCDGAILVISDHQVRCHQAVEVVDQLKNAAAGSWVSCATTSTQAAAAIIRSTIRTAINNVGL